MSTQNIRFCGEIKKNMQISRLTWSYDIMCLGKGHVMCTGQQIAVMDHPKNMH